MSRTDLIPFAVLAVVVAVLAQLPPTNDAAWQFWIATRLTEGAELYRDVIEINPPLWFWLAVPIASGSALLGITPAAGLVVFLGICAAISTALVRILYPGQWLSLALIAAFFLVGISGIGQREQFTLIVSVPYVFLAAARAEDRSVQPWLAGAIGSFAAVGFALKPYFALVPLALELWLLFHRRWRLRPEVIVLVLAAAAYASAILIITPDYFRSVVPLVLQVYRGYNPPLSELLLNEIMLIGILTPVGIALLRRPSLTVQALTVAGLAFVLCYLLQQKGFRYQGLPAIGLLFVAAAIALTEQGRFNLRKIGTIILLEVLVLAVATTFRHRSYPAQPAGRLLCALPPGSSVLVLAPYGNDAWPVVQTCRLRWASRYMFLWMLPELQRAPERHAHIAEATHRAIVADIQRYRPDLILIDRRPSEKLHTDALKFVMADPAFRVQLGDYRPDPTVRSFAVYRRVKRTTASPA